MTVPVRQSLDNSEQPMSALKVQKVFLGIQAGIETEINRLLSKRLQRMYFSVFVLTLDSEAMRNKKNPAFDIGSGFPGLQMPEQGKKHLLNNVLGIVHAQPERTQVAH